jgi:hypothetical protein
MVCISSQSRCQPAAVEHLTIAAAIVREHGGWVRPVARGADLILSNSVPETVEVNLLRIQETALSADIRPGPLQPLKGTRREPLT